MKAHREKEGLKPSRGLDRKSGRSSSYENEGSRMRGYEISAEVERGKSDLRKLKKENETLKQQVWTLRDEYDKLETIVKEMEGDGDGDQNNDGNDDEDDDEDKESEDKAIKNASTKNVIPKIELEEEEENIAENENLENLQKIYSGQVRSVEYTLRQGMEINHDSPSIITHTPNTSNIGQINLHNDHPFLLTPSSELASRTDTCLSQPDPYLSEADHFNLDQLLDFASSFHYDRRKHMTTEENPGLSVSLPKEEGCSIAEADETANDIEENVSSPSANGFSTVRRRSSTIIEKLKGTNTSAVLKEVKQVSLCKDGVTSSGIAFSEPEVSNETTTVSYTRSSYYFAGPLDGRSQSLGTGLNSSSIPPETPEGPLYSSSSASNISGTSSSLDACLPLVSVYSKRTPSMIRLSSIEPNTVMVSVIEMPQLWNITTQEIIDELERQVSPTMPDIRGVRVASRAGYISMGHRESLHQLMQCGLTVRGIKVPLIDITRESIVVALAGVPHYIADATLGILLSAFGTIVGEIERRFYKGVDTGERFVRLKLKKHVKLPKYVTVGGCRIVLGIHGGERQIPQIQDWSNIGNTVPPPTPHGFSLPRDSSITELPEDAGACSNLDGEASEGILLGPACGEVHYHKQSDRRSSVPSPKTFSSRCVVNLKVPERAGSVRSAALVAHREAPLPPSSTALTVGLLNAPSSISAGHVLRVGSLGKGSHSSSEDKGTHGQGGLTVPMVTIKSPIFSKKRGFFSLHDSRPKEQQKNKSVSVAFEDSPREYIRSPPPLPHVPTILNPPTLANGILRKSSAFNSEQEALLPGQQAHGSTATIRSRLKLGKSASHDPGKQRQQAEKEKKKKVVRGKRMESISENTAEDTSDVTPLRASRSGSRRGSDKSSASGGDKSGNKPKKEVIDLPWCGCWGNGCF